MITDGITVVGDEISADFAVDKDDEDGTIMGAIVVSKTIIVVVTAVS